jgi:very-short-patch-repair endonuclease
MKTYENLSDDEKQSLINKLYNNEHKSFQQIAEQLGTYANKVRRDAKKLDIKIRDKSEAQKNALKTGNHKHPTKGTTRDSETKQKIGAAVMNNWDSLSDKELADRKKKAKQQWDNMSQDQKDLMISNANKAVRQSSKTGSKLEKFILNNLLKDGHKVDFHKEQLLSNTKLQIDLFIPSLNVAIEVDGPSHFLPVWGEDVLDRNIKYDNKKTGLILGKGSVLIRIKQVRDFSVARATVIYSDLVKELSKIKTKFPDINNRIIEIGD